jgi:hypothetical protein
MMEVTMHPTDKFVELELNGNVMPARVWEGRTSSGIECHAYITRIAVHNDLDSSEFERDLKSVRAATPAIQAIPTRLVL